MPLISHQIGLSISDATDTSRLAFSRLVDDLTLNVQSTQFTDYLTGSLTLPADGQVIALSPGALTDVRGFYLELTGGGVLLSVNPASAPQSLAVGQPGVQLCRPAGTNPFSAVPAHVYQDGSVSSLYLASADAQVITGNFALWGFAGPTT